MWAADDDIRPEIREINYESITIVHKPVNLNCGTKPNGFFWFVCQSSKGCRCQFYYYTTMFTLGTLYLKPQDNVIYVGKYYYSYRLSCLSILYYVNEACLFTVIYKSREAHWLFFTLSDNGINRMELCNIKNNNVTMCSNVFEDIFKLVSAEFFK